MPLRKVENHYFDYIRIYTVELWIGQSPVEAAERCGQDDCHMYIIRYSDWIIYQCHFLIRYRFKYHARYTHSQTALSHGVRLYPQQTADHGKLNKYDCHMSPSFCRHLDSRWSPACGWKDECGAARGWGHSEGYQWENRIIIEKWLDTLPPNT